MAMQQQQKQRKIDEIKNYLNTAKWVDRTRKYAQNLKDGINTYNNYLNTPNTLKGETVNNIMQPTQNMLSSTAPTLQNGTTSLANGFTSSAMPTTINSVGTGTGSGLTSLGGTSALNAGAGLGSSAGNLGTIGTAAASEASGAGGMGLASLGNIGANIATTAGGEALAGAGTGAGAALGGTTAAGAAGGAGTAGAGLAGAGTAALGALGSVAAPLAAGMMIWNMIDSARKEKQQKAMNLAEKASIDSQNEAEQSTQQAMHNLQLGSQQKKAELANTVAQGMQNQGVAGQLPQLPNTSYNDNLQPNEYIASEGMTGGASPVEEQPIVQTGQVDQTQDNRGLKDHLMSFLSDAGKGFNENNSTTISPKNFGQDTYTTEQVQQLPRSEEVGAYADKLAQDGVKEDVINAYLNEGKNSGNKEIAQWIDSHRDLMDENGNWKPVNKVTQQERKKGIGYRLGEGLGTLNRIASNPITQGLASTAFWLNDGQSLGYSLGKGMEYGANKARSDAYRKLVTGDNSASVFGGYSEKDLNALTNQEYKRIMAEISKERLGETTRHNQVTEGQKDRQLDINYELGKERNNIALKNSNITAARLSEAIRHNKVSEYLSKQRINNNSKYDVQEFNSNLVKYANLLGNPNTTSEQKIKARRGMIENYGKDFINIEKKLENGDL